MARAKALSAASGMVVVAKGPDSFVASPNGALAVGPAAPSWLSVAGSGDVLAGILGAVWQPVGRRFKRDARRFGSTLKRRAWPVPRSPLMTLPTRLAQR